jgi:PilZ domain-containing protein
VGNVREKRAELRVAIMARIEALWQDEAGTQHISPGKLEDLSDGGLCIRVNDAISVGSKLIVQWHRGKFSGTVVQCRHHGQEYVLGIKRDPPQRPDEK